MVATWKKPLPNQLLCQKNRYIHIYTETPSNTKAAPCLTQKAARGILSEPGLPGHGRKVAYEGPTTWNVVGPFFFSYWDVGIISRVDGERKAIGLL